MEYMHRIKKMLCKELEEYADKNKLSNANDLEMIWRLTDTIKNLDKIEMLEEDDGRYSERRYQKRDSMGRYSADDEIHHDYRYSRDDAKDHMMTRLGELMEGATPKEREALKEAMRTIEKA